MIVDFMAGECARSRRWASGMNPYVLLTRVDVIPAAVGYDLLDGNISVLKSSAKSVCLEKLSGGVDCLVVWLALNCWGYRVSKACHGVLEGGELHLDVLGGSECLFALLMRKRFWTGVPKKQKF
jgi:hypothetical protein